MEQINRLFDKLSPSMQIWVGGLLLAGVLCVLGWMFFGVIGDYEFLEVGQGLKEMGIK